MINSKLRQSLTLTYLSQSAPNPRKVISHGLAAINQQRASITTKRKKIPKNENLNEIYELLELSGHVRLCHAKTISRVGPIIRMAYGEKYDIEQFGSVRYGAALPSSDLNLTILDPHDLGNSKRKRSKLPAIYDIEGLSDVLSLTGKFIEVQTRTSSNVPTVMFKDPYTNSSCNIGINNRLGIANSELIKQYCEICRFICPMLLLLKLWSQPLGLNNANPNDPSEPITFSGYALALMTIGFLQIRGLVPNLQADLPPLTSQEKKTFLVDRNTSTLCDVRYKELDDWSPTSEMPSLLSLMRSWFHFWHTYEYSPNYRLCIRRGGLIVEDEPVSRTGNESAHLSRNVTDFRSLSPMKTSSDTAASPHNPKTGEVTSEAGYTLYVMDPFIRSNNVTAELSPAMLKKFKIECQGAALALKWSGNLGVLMPPPSIPKL